MMRYKVWLIVMVGLTLAACSNNDDAPQENNAQSDDMDCWWCVDASGDLVQKDMPKDMPIKDIKNNNKGDVFYVLWHSDITPSTGEGTVDYTEYKNYEVSCQMSFLVKSWTIEDCAECDVAATFEVGELVPDQAECAKGLNEKGRVFTLGHDPTKAAKPIGEDDKTLREKVEGKWLVVGASALKNDKWTFSYYGATKK